MKTQKKKYRLPRKLKKKYGDAWRLKLSMYIFTRSNKQMIRSIINFGNALVSALNTINAIGSILTAELQKGNYLNIPEAINNSNLLIKKS